MEIGIKGYAEVIVDKTNTASSAGSGLLDVFSTPHMIGLMEKAAHESVSPYLEEGQGTVGVKMDVEHLAATPVGVKVWAETELIEVERKMLTFRVAAYTSSEKIGEGVHKRFIISNDKFLEKMNAKYIN